MKVAVATIDGASVSQHFGQSKGFLVFEVQGHSIGTPEFRTNHHTPHAQGLCNHSGEHQHGHGSHSHANILELLHDCKVVLCGGMGAGAVNALRSNGIEPLLLTGQCSPEEAVASYLNGRTLPAGTASCNCHH